MLFPNWEAGLTDFGKRIIMNWLKKNFLNRTWKQALSTALAIAIVAAFLVLLLGFGWWQALISLTIIALLDKPIRRYFEKRKEKIDTNPTSE